MCLWRFDVEVLEQYIVVWQCLHYTFIVFFGPVYWLLKVLSTLYEAIPHWNTVPRSYRLI